MEDVFFIGLEDKGLSIILKREANIILASLDKKSERFLSMKSSFQDVISVINKIESLNPQHDDEINFILNTINRIWNIGVLSSLTLKQDEFLDYEDKNGNRYNIRYSDIYIDKTNHICNKYAFNINIRAVYNHIDNRQIESKPYILHKNHRIYISKGGIITGEYIEKCIIRQDVVDKHCFTIQNIPTIPVSIIIDGDNSIYVVDHREPKLKVLQQFYIIDVQHDEVIANKHYNIRKYIKL